LERIAQEEQEKRGPKYKINQVVFSWEADDRITYNFKGQQKNTYAFLVILVALYFVWVGQPLISLAISAVFFLLYVLYTIPASRVNHAIETVGIRTGGQLFLWEDMRTFWISEKEARMMLYIDTRLTFPARLIFIIDTFNDAERVVSNLLEHIPYMPLRKRQEYFEKMFEGTYIDATTFVKPLTMQELLQMQSQEQEESNKDGSPVSKVTIQKNGSTAKSRGL